jgi:fibro-slime domain-containing protein
VTAELRLRGSKLTVLGLACLAAAPAAAQQPQFIQLAGMVRDFREKTEMGGHPDFENMPGSGLGRYAGGIELSIAEDGKPVYNGGNRKITQQWRDASNRQIAWCMSSQFPAAGDVLGQFGQPSNGGITSASTFSEWFRDVPVYNMSTILTLTLAWNPVSGLYVFDDTIDPFYVALDGFFPIDDRLFGNSPGGNGNANPNTDHNYHFTFEVHTQFQYQVAGAQRFKFTGNNNDVWVFIDGHLVNDLIGVHAAHDQFVDLNRLGLLDGEWYSLDFFFAQRYRPDSHFRIETNIQLESVMLQTVSAVFD